MAMAKKAKRAQKAGHNAEAYLLYSQAAAIDPKNRSYHARMEFAANARHQGIETPASPRFRVRTSSGRALAG